MVSMALDARALAGVRFVTSPLWEVGLSALVLRRPAPGPVHAPWVRAVRERADSLLQARVCALTAGGDFVVDFLTPTGARGSAGSLDVSLDAELGELRALDPEVLRRDLDVLVRVNQSRTGPGHEWVRHVASQPHREMVDHVTRVLTDYWTAALEPHWHRFTRLVADDATGHARAAARDGAGAMLGQIHPRIRFTGAALDIPGACEASLEAADPSAGVLLVPSAFAWPDVHVQPNAPHRPAIAYGVRGLGTLWLSDDAGAEHLVRLLGAGRARVMTTLTVPATTAELAHELSLAPSTVSDHLHALTNSRLAAGTREGRTVIYHLTDLGRALLSS